MAVNNISIPCRVTEKTYGSAVLCRLELVDLGVTGRDRTFGNTVYSILLV
jgi:hypothetical protein